MFQMTIKATNDDHPVLVLSPKRKFLEKHASQIDYDFYRIEKDGVLISQASFTGVTPVSLPHRTHC